MYSPRRSPSQLRGLKPIKRFDPKEFLASSGLGRTVHRCKPRQIIFSQGKTAEAVFYIQSGRVRLSVLSKQGKEATIALLGIGDFFGRGMHRLRSTCVYGDRYCDFGVFCPED